MVHATITAGDAKIGKKGYMVRARLYKGLRTGAMDIGSFFDDEKLRLGAPPGCWYCGSAEKLSVDHIIPQLKGGADGGENLVYACRSCNSSKGSKDLLVWMRSKGRFPPLMLLRRYLKMAIRYCEEHELMQIPLVQVPQLAKDLPFTVDLAPHTYPAPSELSLFVEGQQGDARAASELTE